jgi:hypothetical protein
MPALRSYELGFGGADVGGRDGWGPAGALFRMATSSQLATMDEPPWARKGSALPVSGMSPVTPPPRRRSPRSRLARVGRGYGRYGAAMQSNGGEPIGDHDRIHGTTLAVVHSRRDTAPVHWPRLRQRLQTAVRCLEAECQHTLDRGMSSGHAEPLEWQHSAVSSSAGGTHARTTLTVRTGRASPVSEQLVRVGPDLGSKPAGRKRAHLYGPWNRRDRRPCAPISRRGRGPCRRWRSSGRRS